MREFYPEIEPYRTDFLETGDGHRIYFEECGHPDGVPVVFLHGGPGSASKEKHRRFFNPDKYRIILFHQRGCGHSQPAGLMHNNTTPHLVADMALLRQTLQIDKWVVFGFSWGSTLGLNYLASHPDNVLAAVLGGIFLGIDRDNNYYTYGGVAEKFFPQEFADYLSVLATDELHDPYQAYLRIIADEREPRRQTAIRHWNRIEGVVMLMHYGMTIEEIDLGLDEEEQNGKLFVTAALGTTYFSNECYFDRTVLLEKLATLGHIPAYLFNGRVDMVCPPVTAMRVHKAWPNSVLTLVPGAGHSSSEPVMLHEVITTLDGLADRFFIS